MYEEKEEGAGSLMRKKLNFKIVEIDEKDFTIQGVFSTDMEDRHGEVVVQDGWKLEEFKANPVILAFHDHWQPAVAQAVDIKVEGGKLVGILKFAAAEYEFANTLFKLYAGRYMRAFSVGFRNERYEVNQDDDRIYLLENTLVEISCVNVPANAECLALAKGIDMSSLHEARKKSLENSKRPNKSDEEKGTGVDAKGKPVTIEKQKGEANKSVAQLVVDLDEALKGLTTAIGSFVAQQGELKVAEVKGRTPVKPADGKAQMVNGVNRAIKQLMKIKKVT